VASVSRESVERALRRHRPVALSNEAGARALRVVSSVLVAALLAASASFLVPATVAAQTADANAAPRASSDHWSLLERYCTDCHNAEDWAGGIAFDTMTPDQVPHEAEVWEKVVRKLRGRLMPPPGKPQPDETALHAFVSWMEGTLDEAARLRRAPGHVPPHRLNRKEYANAVRDLLDVEIDPTELLPQDDAQGGFDNIASALQVSPSFIDQYLSAARTVALRAIGNRNARPAGTTYVARDAGTQQFHREGLPLGTRGGIAVEHFFPADGTYEIDIANMAQALWVYNMEFENRLVVVLDGRQVYETTIGGEEDMKAIDQEQDPAVDRINKRLKNIRFRATAGLHTLAVAFVQRTFAESEDRLHMHVPGGGQDRVLRVSSIEIRGPYDVTGVSDMPSRRRVFSCYPRSPEEELPCAEEIVARLATRAYRRPLESADVDALLRFYRAGREAQDFEEGIRRALTAILASPDFLYRAAFPSQSLTAGSVYELSDVDLASRLSFFLWRSIPDEELLSVAAAGRLRDRAELERQVRRMLADPRAATLASDFAFQWLDIGKLDEIDPDPRVFPHASGQGDLRADMREELRLFVESIFREDRNVVDLLTADHTFLNERLALHYGIRTVKGDRFRRVKLENSARFGLLGKGAILMITSYPNRTAPVLRGAWILERVMGTPPAPPPPNVEALEENVAGRRARTVRERMALHSQNPQCFSCHGVMDPLGFALENFDAVGQYRTVDRFAGDPIDSSGVLPDGTVVNGPDDLRRALLRRPDQFVQTFVEKLMTYALGRPLDHHDMPLVRSVVREAARDDYRFSTIVTLIVTSDAFLKSAVPGEGEPRPLVTRADTQQ
jgi:Protein of unknown function (DUF1587)./Protein of unknown function (DUF1592)./Protein of unknown function (DUF1595)./Protein of unknown function (DUF1588)./Protein of unknown function (DUF1585).